MGAHCVQSQSCGFGMRALALVWRCYCRIGARTLWQTYRCVIPLEHERVHLLGSHVFQCTVRRIVLRARRRRAPIFWLAATVGLGFCFLCLQGYEYRHAYRELNLKLSSGVYGSIFFLLTGFHGFHVMLGVLMLTVVLMRLARGHFRPDHHFAFEGAAWYWHFVDVVWLGLYVVVYWL